MYNSTQTELPGQVYGFQGLKAGTSSEQILGRCMQGDASRPLVASKFFTIPWCAGGPEMCVILVAA